MIIYKNRNVEVFEDGTFTMLRSVSAGQELLRVKTERFGEVGYVVTRARSNYPKGSSVKTDVSGKSWAEMVAVLKG